LKTKPRFDPEALADVVRDVIKGALIKEIPPLRGELLELRATVAAQQGVIEHLQQRLAAVERELVAEMTR
jgi:hypothetical protein